MFIADLLFFTLSCVVLVRSSSYAMKHVLRLSRELRLNEFVISFLVVGFVSAFPEIFVTILAMLRGMPEIGLGTVIGSNIADLTLVIGLVVLIGGKVHLHSKTVRYDVFFIILVTLAMLLGLDGMLSRYDGCILVFTSAIFLINILKDSVRFPKAKGHGNLRKFLCDIGLSALAVAVLAVSAYYTVTYAQRLAGDFHTKPLIISTLLIAIGTCLPELTFAVRAMWKKHHDGLAIGDILGNVIIDATLLIGIAALIQPIPITLSYALVNLIALIMALLLVLYFLERRTGLTRRDALLLIALYFAYVIAILTVGIR